MWHLIYNKFKVLISPQYFASRDITTINAQVGLVDMLQDYLKKTDPVLCSVEFYYPKYIEEQLGIRRVFNGFGNEVIFTSKSKEGVAFFDDKFIPNLDERNMHNDILSITIENKIPFILSGLEISRKEEMELLKRYNITILKLDALKEKIKAFLQGFFNYYKFDLLQGVDSPDMAHAMSDPLHKKLYILEDKIKVSDLSVAVKERIRSFVHNRYVDILVTIDKINFYKIQQQILDIERNILDNKEPQFHGAIRYYLNYYLLLIWGYVDHMCLIINDIFVFGYDDEKFNDRKKIGFQNSENKQEFLEKIKGLNENLYSFIISKEFQEWLNVLGQLRHKNAHKEMISPSPLLQPTPASEISDQEIDAIIYKDRPPLEEEVLKSFPSLLEIQKAQDRYHYKISKMDKIFDHVAIIKGGFLDPIARINIDMKNIKKLTELFLEAANNKFKQ